MHFQCKIQLGAYLGRLLGGLKIPIELPPSGVSEKISEQREHARARRGQSGMGDSLARRRLTKQAHRYKVRILRARSLSFYRRQSRPVYR